MTQKIMHGIFGATILSALLFCSEAMSADPQIKILSNGVKVIVKEVHSAPTVSHTVWYRVGSIDEPTGKTGISHILEHMMFKGTSNVPDGEFSKRVAKAGGRDNAFTSQDHTTYFQLIPKDHLRDMMALEADRMVNLSINDASFEKERQVVIEERRLRVDDNQGARFWELLQSKAFTLHPYRQPVIGWLQDLQTLTADDLRKWYQTYYAPNRATVIIVGDVDTQQVFQWADETYGSAKAVSTQQTHSLPSLASSDLPMLSEQRITFKAPTHLPELILIYPAPSLRQGEDDTPLALMLLAQILDGYEGARLPLELVKTKKMATHINVDYDLLKRGPSQFIIAANPSDNTRPADLENAIRAQIHHLLKEGIRPEELIRAKRQLRAQTVYKRDSLFGQALEMGMLEMSGLNFDLQPNLDARLQAINADTVQEVARRIFNKDAVLIGLMLPNGEQPKHPSNPAGYGGALR